MRRSRFPWRVVFHGRVVTVEGMEAVRRAVRESRAEQGLPRYITDPAAIDKVLVLMGHEPKYRRRPDLAAVASQVEVVTVDELRA